MSDTMTLAFDAEALDALDDPRAVFEDARTWSTYVGVVSDKLGYQVVNYLRDQGIYNEDFFSRADKAESLAHFGSELETDRHVFIGRGEDAASLANDHDWEFLSIGDAATKAEWALAADATEQTSRPTSE